MRGRSIRSCHGQRYLGHKIHVRGCLRKAIGKWKDVVDGLSDGQQNLLLNLIPRMKGIMKKKTPNFIRIFHISPQTMCEKQ